MIYNNVRNMQNFVVAGVKLQMSLKIKRYFLSEVQRFTLEKELLSKEISFTIEDILPLDDEELTALYEKVQAR